MSDLHPDDRALLDEARDVHEPTERDRARVRLALLLQLGVGTGLASTTAATSKAATLAVLTKVLAAVAIAGAIGGTGVIAYRAAKPKPERVAAVSVVRASERGSVQPALAPSPPTAALAEPPIPEPTQTLEPTQEAVERTLPSDPKSAKARSTEPAVARIAPPVAVAVAPDSPAPTPTDSVDPALRAPSTENASPATPALPPTTLEAETRLIRAGVAALHAGNASRALALFDEHLQAFPNGALAEERSAERVIALGDLRRCEEARAAAGAFLRDYPHSPLAARVREPCNRASNP